MTAEMQRLANDPNFIVEFAVGDPMPDLVPQKPSEGIRMFGVYFDEPKRYVLKKAHMSREDNRIFDPETGRVVLVSHHPGKNPYDALDPLGLTAQDNRYNVAGGEWESVCDVSARSGEFRNFKIRPKTFSRHGRQYIKRGNDETVLNVGKMGKLKSMSLRDHFIVGKEEDTDMVYKCVADMLGRSVVIENEKEEVVAQIAKTTKALLQTAVFGSGSESTIDIAPGVDCSTILAVVYGMGQVGAHCKLKRHFFSLLSREIRTNLSLLFLIAVMGDVFNNFLLDPAQDAIVDSAVDAAGLGEAVDGYTDMSNEAFNAVGALTRTARFFQENFFSEE